MNENKEVNREFVLFFIVSDNDGLCFRSSRRSGCVRSKFVAGAYVRQLRAGSSYYPAPYRTYGFLYSLLFSFQQLG